jgi:hypothetical protein
MNSVLATKSEPGMWCKKVEFELDRFIFVAPKPLPEEEWTKLCEKYGEHQTRVLVGDALLIDLRGKEPTFVSIPADFKGDFRQWKVLPPAILSRQSAEVPAIGECPPLKPKL